MKKRVQIKPGGDGSSGRIKEIKRNLKRFLDNDNDSLRRLLDLIEIRDEDILPEFDHHIS